MKDTGATVGGRKVYPGTKVEKFGTEGSPKDAEPKASEVAAMGAKTSTDGQHNPKPGESKPDVEKASEGNAQTVRPDSAADKFYPKKG